MEFLLRPSFELSRNGDRIFQRCFIRFRRVSRAHPRSEKTWGENSLHRRQRDDLRACSAEAVQSYAVEIELYRPFRATVVTIGN